MAVKINIDLDNLNPGTKFLLDDANESAGYVVLRTAGTGTMAAIRKQAVKKKAEYRPNPKVGNRLERIEFQEVDDELLSKLLWDYVIMEMSVPDVKGAIVPDTIDMKYLLMTECQDFNAFVSKCLDTLKKDEEAEAVAVEGN